MGCPLPERGFSLIGILVSVVIVGILMTLALQTYQPVLTSFETGMGDRPSFRLDISRAQMKRLHQAEMVYFQVHRKYATWDELIRDGQIQRGYSNRAQGPGTPFMPCYDIDIRLTGRGFVITATPDLSAGAAEGTPVLRIDQSGALEEVPTQ